MTARVLIGARGGFTGAAESRLHLLMHVSSEAQRRSRPWDRPRSAYLTAKLDSFPWPPPLVARSKVVHCKALKVKKVQTDVLTLS